MTYALLLIICVNGTCTEHKPEGDWPMFYGAHAKEDCREVRNTIIAVVRQQMEELGVLAGITGICPTVVKESKQS